LGTRTGGDCNTHQGDLHGGELQCELVHFDLGKGCISVGNEEDLDVGQAVLSAFQVLDEGVDGRAEFGASQVSVEGLHGLL